MVIAGPEVDTEYVGIERVFAPLRPDEVVTAEQVESWGGRYFGALGWTELLQSHRVVVLAEAGAGKTEEFRARARDKAKSGGFGFFATIDQIAKESFSVSLGREVVRFHKWRESREPGWFFLDSLDEARVNQQDFDLALAKFSHEIEAGLDRAHIFVSCRSGPLWGGKDDLRILERHLPPPIDPGDVQVTTDPREALLAPFRETTSGATKRSAGPQPSAVKLVRLLEFTSGMRREYLVGKNTPDPDRFEAALMKRGLAPLAARPGDLNLLIEYWETHRDFGSLREMMEFSVDRRLREREGRPDADIITEDKAREGAERIAAALTLTRASMIRSPREPDGAKGTSVLDVAEVLKDWRVGERTALLSRGLFAPAIYGALRMQHRSLQEYLTASWLEDMIDAGAPMSAIVSLLFSAPHGIKTIAPTFRPIAAWLAVKSRLIRQLILEREPTVLIAFGDPSHLTLNEKQAALTEYARKEAKGDISDHFIEDRSIGLFAEPELGPSVRQAWGLNEQADFRFFLVRLILAGPLGGCRDLISLLARDTRARAWQRIYAIDGLKELGDERALAEIAQDLVARSENWKADFAPKASLAVFPRFLSLDALLQLIAACDPSSEYGDDGFGSILAELFALCADKEARRIFMGGIANLCLTRPFSDWPKLSKRYRDLTKRLRPLARAAVIASDQDGVSTELLEILLVASRAQREDDERDGGPSLGAEVSKRLVLKRRLMWVHAAFETHEAGEGKAPTTVWHLHWPYYWKLLDEDETWLKQDLRGRAAVHERLIALSALVSIARSRGELEHAREPLERLVHGDEALERELARYLAPYEKSEAELRHDQWEKEHQARKASEEVEREKVWTAIAARVQSTPNALCDRERLAVWPGPADLQRLTNWLSRAADRAPHSRVAVKWQLLRAAFGNEVTEAYRAGMQLMWRITAPERPSRRGTRTSRTWTSILSFGGLEIESSLDPKWAEKLDAIEVERAALHAILSDDGYPDWFAHLLKAHPKIVEPLLIAELTREWRLARGKFTPFLNQAFHDLPLLPATRGALLALVQSKPPRWVERLQEIQRLVVKLALAPPEQKLLLPIMKRRFSARLKSKDWVWAMHYAALVMELDVAEGIKSVERLIAAVPEKDRDEWAERVFGAFFGHSRGSVYAIRHASAEAKVRLLRLAYQYVRPSEDTGRRSGEVDRRDEAEGARNQLLNLVMDTRGEVSFAAMAVFADGQTGWRYIRFRQLAKRMAERDAEPPAWSCDEVRQFERRWTAPAKTGAELLDLVCGVLSDIDLAFRSYDASSRDVLQSATGEPAVQTWLFEQFELRANGRYQVYREPEVKKKRKPDIVVSSAAAAVSVAVEAKHGGKQWTLKTLRRALKTQLAKNYLKPANRRHGVFVITNHSDRYWVDKEGGERLSFDQLIDRLRRDAHAITRNEEGEICVRVAGIDASAEADEQADQAA